MSQKTTIRKLAELVNTPVEKLLEQLSEAGMPFKDADEEVTSAQKVKLLGFLRRTHGRAEPVGEIDAAPKKITLARRKVQEITVGGGKNKQTVDVVVRKKVTQVNRGATATDDAGPVSDERADALRKLEESRARNLAEQQALAEKDRQRAEELAEIRRREQEEAERAAAEAAAAAAAALAARLGRAGDVHRQVAAAHVAPVQRVDGGLRLGGRAHLDEAEALRAAAVAVHHDLGRLHRAVGGEVLLQVFVTHRIGKIADVKFLGHRWLLSSWIDRRSIQTG